MKTLWEQAALGVHSTEAIPCRDIWMGGSDVTLAAWLIFLLAAELSSQLTCPQLQVRMTKMGEAEARVVSEPERTVGDSKGDATRTPWTRGECDQAGSSYCCSLASNRYSAHFSVMVSQYSSCSFLYRFLCLFPFLPRRG